MAIGHTKTSGVLVSVLAGDFRRDEHSNSEDRYDSKDTNEDIHR